MLLREIPQAEPEADQAEILMMGAHPGVEAGALVDLEGLLEEAGRLAAFAQVLVDQPEIVERGDQAVAVVDAAEGGGRVLQPLDRVRGLPEARAAQPAHDGHAPDRAMVVGVAQHAVGIERKTAAAAVFGLLDQRARQPGGDAGAEA